MGNPNKIWHDIYSLVFLGSMQKLTSIVGHSSDRTRLPRYRNSIFKRYCPPGYPGEERMSRRKWSLLIGLIGSVMFNVGWWISYPPMVFAGVLLAAAGLDLWIGR